MIVKALEKAGGTELVSRVMDEKVATGETYLTRIHHRETIHLLRDGLADAGPVWLSEALYQQHGTAFNYVTIPAEHDIIGQYFIAQVEKTSCHPDAASKFVDFMTSASGQKIYAGYGFLGET